MTDDGGAINLINSFDADDRALAIHEAGHAVVARALGAEEEVVMKPSAREGRAQGVGAGDCEPSHRRVEKIIDSGGTYTSLGRNQLPGFAV